MVKNLPASAGEVGSIPGPGRSHMPRSNQACVLQLLKPTRLEPVLHNQRNLCSEKAKQHDLLATARASLVQPKINKVNLKNTFQTEWGGREAMRRLTNWRECSVSWKGSCLQSCWENSQHALPCQRWAHHQLFAAALNCPVSLLAHLCFH